ncbi:hypothetical protein PV325_007208, partial [Microctonus aethiopoides]
MMASRHYAQLLISDESGTGVGLYSQIYLRTYNLRARNLNQIIAHLLTSLAR